MDRVTRLRAALHERYRLHCTHLRTETVPTADAASMEVEVFACASGDDGRLAYAWESRASHGKSRIVTILGSSHVRCAREAVAAEGDLSRRTQS